MCCQEKEGSKSESLRKKVEKHLSNQQIKLYNNWYIYIKKNT